jgi:hypothetical protein
VSDTNAWHVVLWESHNECLTIEIKTEKESHANDQCELSLAPEIFEGLGKYG